MHPLVTFVTSDWAGAYVVSTITTQALFFVPFGLSISHASTPSPPSPPTHASAASLHHGVKLAQCNQGVEQVGQGTDQARSRELQVHAEENQTGLTLDRSTGNQACRAVVKMLVQLAAQHADADQGGADATVPVHELRLPSTMPPLFT